MKNEIDPKMIERGVISLESIVEALRDLKKESERTRTGDIMQNIRSNRKPPLETIPFNQALKKLSLGAKSLTNYLKEINCDRNYITIRDLQKIESLRETKRSHRSKQVKNFKKSS